MKIGQFSNDNKISKDTVRHYIDIGLLFPLKNGAHFEFDQNCQQDLQDILLFKKMGFSLQEIKKIFSFKRIGRLTHYQAAEYYKQFFEDKQYEITEQIKELLRTKEALDIKINQLSNYKPNHVHKMGVDLSALPWLICHECKGELDLKDGTIESHQLLEGILSCSCGQEYRIIDGIFYSFKQSNKRNVINKEYIVDYIKETPANYIDLLYEGGIWFEKNIDFKRFNKSVILELGVGVGHFLRYIYNQLPDDMVYFAVDHNIKRLTLLKRLLEGTELKKKIIFVCSDFLSIPVKEQSINVLIDITGSSNYAFNNNSNLINHVRHLIKPYSYFVGGYLIFKQFNHKSIVKKEHRDHFKEDPIIRNLEQNHFKIVNDFRTKSITEGGKYESYISEGETVYSYLVCAERNSN